MKSKRRAALLAITENIEMELFSSMESCVVILTQEKEEFSLDLRHLEHPLVCDCEEEPEPQVQTRPRQQAKPRTEPPAKGEVHRCPPVPEFTGDIEIEMEEFPPLRVSGSELVEMKASGSSIMSPPSPNKASRPKWKSQALQRTGLVVKDVVCLPRGQHLTQEDRHAVPQDRERAALAAAGWTARITVDGAWSANQMQSRLAMLFRGRIVKRAGQRFSFTYLQCVQSSRVLFVPDTPAEGWTGEQVLRISGHGPLYVLGHQDDPQAECGRSAREIPLENRTEFRPDEDKQLESRASPPDGGATEEWTPDLDSIVRRFRQAAADGDVETDVLVRRREEVLRAALTAVRRPDFCFRAPPNVSFSGEETDGREGPLREFFRLALLELQESSVFEGLPGRLLLTYDLTALEDRKYFEAGVLISWSLAQGGPGPRCLHPALYQLMCGQNPPLEDFSWSDIVDAEAQIRLKQLHGCTDVELLSPGLCEWVSNCGIPGIYSARSDEIPAVYTRLVKHYIFHRVASMISQFKEGMNSCGGLWDTMQSHWELFVPVMTSAQRRPLTLEEFKRLFAVRYAAGGQQRAAEEATVGHWEAVLGSVGDGQADFSFEDLLVFITGADHPPPIGFDRSISLRFYYQDASAASVRLPYASTCALELFLPRGAPGAADLMLLLSRAVHEAAGFARVQTERDGEDGRIQEMTSSSIQFTKQPS